jgi:hypothetical protein
MLDEVVTRANKPSVKQAESVLTEQQARQCSVRKKKQGE